MSNHGTQDWPVYIMLGAVACFIIYVIIQGNKEEKKNKEDNKTKNKQ